MCCNSFRKCLCCKCLCCKLQHSEQELSPQKNENLWRIWEQLHKSRELEISTQWNRVIFLSSFIVLTLTGNAICFYKTFVECSDPSPSGYSTFCGIVLGILLLCAGGFWVAMTKGSKYWMNIYERKIDLVEKELQFNQFYEQFCYLEEKYVKEIPDKAADGAEYIPKQSLVKCSFWGQSANSTSPSKTNILIGWLLIFLSALFTVPYFLQYKSIVTFLQNIQTTYVFAWIRLSLVFVGIVMIIQYVLRHTPGENE